MSERVPPVTGSMSGLENRAFRALRIPRRTVKPRDQGLTIVADRGLGSHAQADLLEVAAEFVDWVKICSTSPRLYSTDLLRRKIDGYHGADVRVFITGDGFELGVAQGVMDDLYGEAASLGCDGFEVASAQVVLALDAKASLVELAARHGLHVFAEIGRKGERDRRAHSGWLSRQAEVLLAAGAYRVLLQGEGIVEDVDEIDEGLLLDLASRFDLDTFVFQAKDARAQRWFIEHFGPDVSLDVESHQVIPVELARRGLAKRGLVGLISGGPAGPEV